MLCTKSPNRFKYADNLDAEFAEIEFEFRSSEGAGTEDFSVPRERSPSADAGDATPEACAEASTTDCAIEWVCECECPWESSSLAPRTRKVFSMMKNAANPTKIPSLGDRIRVSSLQCLNRHRIEPYKDIPFFFDHNKMNAGALKFTHK
jgi:hypothetical protein